MNRGHGFSTKQRPELFPVQILGRFIRPFPLLPCSPRLVVFHRLAQRLPGVEVHERSPHSIEVSLGVPRLGDLQRAGGLQDRLLDATGSGGLEDGAES